MRISLRRVKLALALSLVAVGVAVGVVNFTDACRLDEVTLDGQPVNDWPSRFDMLRQRSLFRQPLDSLGRAVLAGEGMFKVDISMSWPHTLNIRTNAFRATCFFVDKAGGRLCGLQSQGRIVPLKSGAVDWERPVLTGVEGGRMFSYCRDARVKVVVEQLQELRERNLNLFRLVDEVDFETVDYVHVSMSGLPYRLKIRSEQLAESLDRFIAFVTKFAPDMSGTGHVDLRFDNMIICACGKN